jgi:hypothetical protein
MIGECRSRACRWVLAWQHTQGHGCAPQPTRQRHEQVMMQRMHVTCEWQGKVGRICTSSQSQFTFP